MMKVILGMATVVESLVTLKAEIFVLHFFYSKRFCTARKLNHHLDLYKSFSD